jgi:hypothetical protein
VVGVDLEEGAALEVEGVEGALEVEGVEGVVSEAEPLGAEAAVDSGAAGRSEYVSSWAFTACASLPRSLAGVVTEVKGARRAALALLTCGAAAAFVFMNYEPSQPLACSRSRAVTSS